MQFLGNLGVDPWLLLAQIINFVFLLWVLNAFAYKPLLKRIEKDEQKLQEVARTQRELQEKEKQIAITEKRITTRTKNRAKAIIEEAEEIAEHIKHTAQEEAQEEKDAVIAQIHKRLNEIPYE